VRLKENAQGLPVTRILLSLMFLTESLRTKVGRIGGREIQILKES